MCSDLRSWPVFGSLEPEFISQIHMVMVFGKTFGNKALIVTKDKTVYILDENLHDCLETGYETSGPYLKEIEDLCGKDIKTFAYGMGPHILALTNGGEVYSCDDVNGQSENGTCNKVLAFTLMNVPTIEDSQNVKHVVDIACGYYHSTILTENGEVYAWASNNNSQVGNSTNFLSTTPKLVLSNVVCISCGDNFTMAVTRNGKVYGWGSNDFGQLGIDNYGSKNATSPNLSMTNNICGSILIIQMGPAGGSFENKNITPQLIGMPEDLVVVKVTCGLNHTLVLTDKGNIYAWGANNFGQLGIGNKELGSSKPVMAKQMEKTRWIDIAALNNSSIAVNEAGRVYVWGDCRGKSILTPTGTSSFNVHDALAHYGPSIMHKPLILDEELDILGCLGIAFDDSSTSDLKIQVEDKCIHVHKAILKIRSLYFRKMFEHDWAENNQSVIKINEFSYVVYEEYLKFLYTNIISLSFEKISELFDLAIAYCENNLKKHCIRRIKQRITISNVAYFYSFAVKYDIEELEEFCVQFAVSHMMAVTRTENFAKLDQNLMKTFIIKASEAGCFRN
ncbi:RCC1 and BTB domain-containing protein 1 [Mycetomoellerius zeteki]|uniref:RCC1 and BTB domain-containing protein 1 n=1 Tax=Mycetomoellerius zeteki TaxID=64791 RepID=UPI00084E6DFF|nr:PREDICTED: RCC1 and BTB domain-containing protein 1-like [Trachymyrmex zeteki]